MDGDQTSINVLPDEILLSIFRRLSAMEFITTLPCVSERWSKIVSMDSFTINKIAIRHKKPGEAHRGIQSAGSVDFIYMKNKTSEQQVLYTLPKDCDDIALPSHIINFFGYDPDPSISYETAFYLSTQFPEMFKHIKTLIIMYSNFRVYPLKDFAYLNNLTTLILYKVNIADVISWDILMDMGNVYPNIQNLLYVKCDFHLIMEKQLLYSGFKKLKRFRLEHKYFSHKDLHNLLTTHPKLVRIIIDTYSEYINDSWIEVMLDKLEGRTIKYLRLYSKDTILKYESEFLKSNLFDDKTKLNLGLYDTIPFAITID